MIIFLRYLKILRVIYKVSWNFFSLSSKIMKHSLL